MKDEINPFTALVRAHPPIPMTLTQMLDHVADKSEDGGHFALIISEADLSKSPECYDLEMVTELEHGFSNRMECYCLQRLKIPNAVSEKILRRLLAAVKADRERVTSHGAWLWADICRMAFHSAQRISSSPTLEQRKLVAEWWEQYRIAMRADAWCRFNPKTDREIMARLLGHEPSEGEWAEITRQSC
jgi:hypothetical protein